MDATATLAEAFRLGKASGRSSYSSLTATPHLLETMNSRILSAFMKEGEEKPPRTGRKFRSGIRSKRVASAPQGLDELTDLGNDLMDIVDCLGDVLAWMTTLEVLLDVSVITIGLFLFSSLFDGLGNEGQDGTGDRLLFACSPLMGANVAAACLYRLLLVCRSGQRLQTELHGVREALVDSAVDSVRRSGGGGYRQEDQVFEHLALRERMKEGGVLEPGGYFQLNNGLFSSAFATMVNYLLVLVAFKIDLSPDCRIVCVHAGL